MTPPRAGQPTSTLPLATRHERTTPLRGFGLRVQRGADRGARYTARREVTRIGTHASCDLVLQDATVSRFHCEIVVSASRVLLRDLGSRNGTWVNGIEVREAWLERNATLGLGETTLAYTTSADAVDLPVSERDHYGMLVGASPAMRAVYALLERVAASDAPALLQGETGTGKDLAAHAIHEASARAGGPWVVVDCTALPPGLAESELFGHVRGAFTGAVDAYPGAFARASGGTLFLDEIGELGPELQPKLLRLLESGVARPIGGTADVAVDVRAIAATNRDLRREVNAGRFRADLYYRLAVLEVRLPPLRERLEDIPALVEDWLGRLGAASSPAAASLRRPEQLQALAAHAWPGNVRELGNHVQRSLMLPIPPLLGAENAPGDRPEIDPGQPLQVERERLLRWFERRYLEGLLARHGGNVTAAAGAAGVDRVHLHRLLSRAGLR